MQIFGEKDALLSGLHAIAPDGGGLEWVSDPPVVVIAENPGTAVEFDVDARVHAAFSTWQIYFPVPRKKMPGLPISWEESERSFRIPASL